MNFKNWVGSKAENKKKKKRWVNMRKGDYTKINKTKSWVFEKIK